MNGLHFSTLSVIIIQNMIGSAHLYVVHISLLCSFVCCALLDITIKAPLCHYSFVNAILTAHPNTLLCFATSALDAPSASQNLSKSALSQSFTST